GLAEHGLEIDGRQQLRIGPEREDQAPLVRRVLVQSEQAAGDIDVKLARLAGAEPLFAGVALDLEQPEITAGSMLGERRAQKLLDQRHGGLVGRGDDKRRQTLWGVS